MLTDLETSWPLLAPLVPALVLAAAAAWTRRCSAPAAAWSVARNATVVTVVAAVLVAALRIIDGTSSGWLVRLDSLTAVMLGLIVLVGWVVVRFSSTYLAGDPFEQRYAARLLATLAAVSVVVVANHLVVLVAAWAAASFALHGLLIFFGDRPVAMAVAHKKFLLARVADACMVGAVIAFATAFDTLRTDEITARAVAADDLPPGARVAVGHTARAGATASQVTGPRGDHAIAGHTSSRRRKKE